MAPPPLTPHKKAKAAVQGVAFSKSYEEIKQTINRLPIEGNLGEALFGSGYETNNKKEFITNKISSLLSDKSQAPCNSQQLLDNKIKAIVYKLSTSMYSEKHMSQLFDRRIYWNENEITGTKRACEYADKLRDESSPNSAPGSEESAPTNGI